MDYTKRELDTHFDEIKTTLARIEAQTVRTNGRVTNLESWRSSSIGWTAGAGACIVIIMALVTYIFNLRIDTVAQAEIKTQTLIEQHSIK